jgi:hypothetical protein
MKTKSISLILLATFIMVSCVPAVTITTTGTVMSTITSSPTQTPIPTSTPTLQPTKTPLPICNDQQIGDSAEAGIPELPIAYRGGNLDLQKIVSTRSDEFNIFKQTLHNRVVTVAIPKSLKLTEKETSDYAEFSFRTWEISWEEFGGFPFSSYTLIAGADALTGLPTRSYTNGNGAIIQNTRTAWASHEIFHAWFGGALSQTNNTDWFIESVTCYYGNARLQNEAPYEDRLQESFTYYLTYYNDGKDRKLDFSYNPSLFMAHKGAVLAYALDLELQKSGHNLGEVLKFMYLKYATKSNAQITDKDILEAFNEVSGIDFTEFFQKYVYGKELLPVDKNDSLKWVCHD